MRLRLVVTERITSNVKCVRAALERLESGRDVLRTSDFGCRDLEAERMGRCLNLAHVQHGAGIADIGDDRQPAKTGDGFAQEFDSLAGEIGRLDDRPVTLPPGRAKACDQAVADRVRRHRENDRDDRRRLLCRGTIGGSLVTMTRL